jgi:hypothetical protein
MAKKPTPNIPKRGADSSTGWRNESHEPGERVAVYPYTDKDGCLVARVCRKEWQDEETGEPKKSFPTHSLIEPLAPPWDANDDKLPWQQNAPPEAMRPLYRLKELLDAPYDATVFIPEGEKDVDTCVRLGFTATTAMRGADYWLTIYGFVLEGRKVVILIDNDDKGRIRGEFLRRKLSRVAASVQVVLPPGVGPKGDISDWATNNPKATRKDIKAMLKANRLPPLKAPEDDELLAGVNRMMKAQLRREGWKDIRERNKLATKSKLNVATALDLLEVSVRFDEFNNKTLTSNTGKAVYDAELVEEVATWISKRVALLWEVNFSKQAIIDEIAERASSAHFNPVCDWRNGLNWDKVPRLNKSLHTYFGAADTELNEAYGAKWWIAAVRRATAPRTGEGVKFDNVLVLEGPQGIGKSSALRIIGGRWFTDSLTFHVIDDTKRVMEAITGKVIVEMPELVGYRRKEMEEIKSFFSRQTDKDRLSYRRDPQELARTVVFAITTNAKSYLSDDENRRFWCVQCGAIDLEGLAWDREQLWAEAAVRAATDESVMLPETLWVESAKEAEKRKVEDLVAEAWMNQLSGLVDEKTKTFAHPDGIGMVYTVTYEKLFNVLRISPGTPITGNSPMGRSLRQVMGQLGWNGPKKFDDLARFWRLDKDKKYEM